MKFTTIFLVLSLALIYSCKDTPSRPGAILDENYEPITPVGTTNTTATTPPAPGAEPPQNAAGVWHYTCPTGCTGGSGSATPCATCGTTLVHNTGYHDNAGGTPAVTANTNTGAALGAGGAVGSITNPVINGIGQPAATPVVNPGAAKTPEPAQNAAGVWHYTCSAGCAGGAGSAVACAGCGSTLVHNTVYHN